MTQVACEYIKAAISCKVIHASMHVEPGGNRACGRVLCPGWPLIQYRNEVTAL